MASARKPRIVVVEDDLSASDAGMELVTSVRKEVTATDAIITLMGIEEVSEDSALFTEEINTVAVELTDKEVADLQKKSGVVAVEDDVWNHASMDSEYVDPDIPTPDEEAAAQLDESHSAIENAELASDEEMAAQIERMSAMQPAEFDDIDFDQAGQAFVISAVSDPMVTDTADAAGIDKEKLVKLIGRVIKCALSELSDRKATEVDESLVSKLLAENGVAIDDVNVQAIRDYITCGLRVIYAPQAWRCSTGAGVRTAIVDTGIARRHPDLRVYGGASFVPGVGSWADDHGHGTHVAGTVAAVANNRGVVGVAPHSRLYGVKVLNRQGSGRTSWIINGLVWCYRTQMHVVNLSLGDIQRTHDPRVYSRAYENAGRLLRRRGILAVAAAGNANGPVSNPARCPSFMAVSAVDCGRRRAPFSCYGPQVEITAPGVGIWSTYPQSIYKKLSGTSMASPHVAGVAALVKRRYPAAHGDAIRVHLWRTATDLGPAGRDIAYGYGLVNAYRSVC